MQHVFSRRWEFELNFKTLTDLHLGTGETTYATIDQGEREVLAQAKDVDGKAYLPSTALKGAMRATGEAHGSGVELLFGKVGEEPKDASAGALVVYGGELVNKPAMNNVPHPNKEAGTYIVTHHARERGTLTVLPDYLFHVEHVVRGCNFKSGAMFFPGELGDADATSLLEDLLGVLAAEDGFTAGAGKTTIGRLRLTDRVVTVEKNEIVRKVDDDGARERISVKVEPGAADLQIRPAPARDSLLSIHVPGPLLIADPARGQVTAVTDSERREVVTELRYTAKALAGWERALRQSLRSLTGYLEATLDWASRGRVDDPFIPYSAFENLTSTQRLFGVEGYRGVLSLHVYSAKHERRGVFPGLELDALTQGPLKHAAYAVHCPVDAEIAMRIGVDTNRYRALLEGIADEDTRTLIETQDRALVARLNGHVGEFGLRAGAKVSRGYGWFTPHDLDLSLERTPDGHAT